MGPLLEAIKGSQTQDLEGLDIFWLPNGPTVDDAINRNNGAHKWAYFPTNGLESKIHIHVHDLSIREVWSFLWGGYKVNASENLKI